MARVTKKKLAKDLLEDLFMQLNTCVTSLNTRQADLFLQELLGPEERIMLAKRLATIVMLIEGYSLYRTSETLKVSPATADKIRRRLQRGDYNNLISMFKKKKKDYLAILDTIDSILHLGGILPHYNGLDRYRSLR